jgi:AAA+ ATPase superfamily predicted ATPase
MANFIGRETYLQTLNKLLQKRVASLVVIRGRRRIGKSRLAHEFGKQYPFAAISGLAPKEDTTAQMERDDFSSQLSRIFGMPPIRTEDWGDLFWHLGDRSKEGRQIILLDEIQWMGSKDPTFLGKLKNAWDLQFSKNSKLILILSGSMSSWIEKNIISSTGFLGRISLDIQLRELALDECSQFWGNQLQIDSFEKLKFLCVTGGVPRYLEELISEETAEQNIKRLCFSPGGFLVTEFENIFSDLFSKRNVIYKHIVQQLAQGPKGVLEIAAALRTKKSGTLSNYLEDLSQAGFISRDFTWHLKNGKSSKLSHYRLSDNYVRFYLKHIDSVKNKIQNGSLTKLPNWHSIMGLQLKI